MCGAEVVRKKLGRPARYCGSGCRELAKGFGKTVARKAKAQAWVGNCTTCHREITGRRRKHCQYDCRVRTSNPKRHPNTCSQCRQAFVGVSGQRFCSMACNRAAKARQSTECPTCNTVFVKRLPTQKYCSNRCVPRLESKRPFKTCEQCGDQFRRKVNRGGHRDAERFCSRECAFATLKEQAIVARALRKAEQREKAEQHCIYCGVSVGRYTQPRYCSTSCKWQAYKTRRPDILDVVRRRGLRRYATDLRARVVAKQRAHRRRTRMLEAFVEHVDFDVIYARDGGVCQICFGAVDPTLGKRLPLGPSYDHIVPLARGGLHEASNIQLTHYRCNLSKGRKLMSELRMPA